MNTNFRTDVAQKIARDLLSIGAIKINTHNYFQWSSGIASPIYCDNRTLLSYPTIRNYIKKNLIACIQKNFEKDALEAIAGVATAGISHGTLVADVLDLPFYYVRNQPKKHGLKNNIEGKEIVPHQKILVIEDLISTGNSAFNACKSLQAAGATVLGVVTIINYGLAISKEKFATANIPLYSLSNFDILIQQAIATTHILPKACEQLKKWRQDLSLS